MPSRSTAPISLLICFLCSSSLRGPAFGSWLKTIGLQIFRNIGVDQPNLAVLGIR